MTRSLFDTRQRSFSPLADRLRPKNLDEFIGQEEVMEKGKPLRTAIERDELQSAILWGPPGSGKTTLARIIAESTKSYFQPFSAAVSGVGELRGFIKDASERLKLYKKRTILFVDEIHRFNKTQQDAFLPYVEDGTIILIGATTENPSFELNGPLLSRSLIFVLKPLSHQHIKRILGRAISDKERGLGNEKIHVLEEALEKLAAFADGDARAALNALEFVAASTQHTQGNNIIDGRRVEEAFQKKAILYDKSSEEHYNLISAFIKYLRDSDPDAALYWMTRMLEGGEDPRFIARRILVFASEDVGNADPLGIVVASAVADAVEYVGMPESAINLAQGVTYLASAPKDNASYKALMEAWDDTKKYGALPAPLHLRNAVTNLTKELGYGKGYKYAHDFKDAKTDQEHFPQKLKKKKYYPPRKRRS